MDSTDNKIETSKMENQKLKANRTEILFNGYFYDVTDFIKRHPGGGIISYYTQNAEDATHAIQQFHQRSQNRVNGVMSSLKKRPASDSELGLNAKILEKNRALSEDFTKLYLELEREGLFEPSYAHTFLRIAEVVIMAGVGYGILGWEDLFAKFIGIIFLGVAQGRCAWLAHEFGHNSMTGIPKLDRFLEVVIYGKSIVYQLFQYHNPLKPLGLGLGGGATWWIKMHNRHHAMPQRLHKDVDLNTLPLLAFNAKVVKNPKDGSNFMVRNQAYLLMLIDTLLIAILYKTYIHPEYVIRHKLFNELAAMTGHWLLLYQIGFSPSLLSLWIRSLCLILNFTLSHTFLPVTTEPKHWVEYSLLHTADVEHTGWCNWWMGYLNYQIEHHLFPTMPQFRQPLITHRVKALSEKHNIPYLVNSYPEAVRKVLKNFYDVSNELKHSIK